MRFARNKILIKFNNVPILGVHKCLNLALHSPSFKIHDNDVNLKPDNSYKTLTKFNIPSFLPKFPKFEVIPRNNSKYESYHRIVTKFLSSIVFKL